MTEYLWSEQNPVSDSSGHANELSGFMNGKQFMKHWKDYQLLKDSAPGSHLLIMMHNCWIEVSTAETMNYYYILGYSDL